MTEFEKWSNNYKQGFCTVEDLKLVCFRGKITYDEYATITGEELTEIDIRTFINTEVKAYKHEYSMWGTYDGHPQRFTTDDKFKMKEAQESLEMKILPQITWYYDDGTVTTSDPNYFVSMRMYGGLVMQKAYAVEPLIAQEISTMTLDKLKQYDIKKRFDEIFKSLP